MKQKYYIKTIHECVIQYSFYHIGVAADRAEEKLSALVWNLDSELNSPDIETTDGGLAWDPYITLTSENKECVVRAAKKIVKKIESLGGEIKGE